MRSDGIPSAGSRRVRRMSSTPRTGTCSRKAMNAVRRATGKVQFGGVTNGRASSSEMEMGQAATSTSSGGRVGAPATVSLQRSPSGAQVTRSAAFTRASRAASRRASALVTAMSTGSGSVRSYGTHSFWNPSRNRPMPWPLVPPLRPLRPVIDAIASTLLPANAAWVRFAEPTYHVTSQPCSTANILACSPAGRALATGSG